MSPFLKFGVAFVHFQSHGTTRFIRDSISRIESGLLIWCLVSLKTLGEILSGHGALQALILTMPRRTWLYKVGKLLSFGWTDKQSSSVRPGRKNLFNIDAIVRVSTITNYNWTNTACDVPF